MENFIKFLRNEKKYNYQKIKEEIKKNPDCVPAGDIIDLDILRTCFEKDKDEISSPAHVVVAAGSNCCITGADQYRPSCKHRP